MSRLLPEYAKPPVVEVACSIQFEPIEQLHAGRLGLLWEKFRNRYPTVEQQPPLPATREQFELGTPRVELNVEAGFPMPRLWFLTEDGTRLIQVQRDHFILNWRRRETGQAYPRYRTLRRQLLEELALFQDFLEREGLPAVRPTQTELTYVNHIDAREPDGSRKPLGRIVRTWADDVGGALPAFEQASFKARYIIRHGDVSVGRLHITLDPHRYVKDNAPLYVLTLVARGTPAKPDMHEALAFLDSEHEVIVEGFTAVTTNEMHTTWERQR